MYLLSTGRQWRAIPKDLPPSRHSRTRVPHPLRAGRSSSKRGVRSPPRSTVHDYFDLWSWDGTLDRIRHELYVKCRDQADQDASPTAAIIDSQTVKSAEKGRRASTRMAMMRARVRLDCAHHQWRQVPPRKLSIDLVADERLGRVTGRAEAS
jgi:transposase